MLVRSNAIDIIVLDSVAALTSKAEIDGDVVISISELRMMANVANRLLDPETTLCCFLLLARDESSHHHNPLLSNVAKQE